MFKSYLGSMVPISSKTREDWDIKTNNSANSWINQTYQQLLFKFCPKCAFIQPSGWNLWEACFEWDKSSHQANWNLSWCKPQNPIDPTSNSISANYKIQLFQHQNPSYANIKPISGKLQNPSSEGAVRHLLPPAKTEGEQNAVGAWRKGENFNLLDWTKNPKQKN